MDTDRFIEQVRHDGRSELLLTVAIWEYYEPRNFLYDDVLDWLHTKNPADVFILTAAKQAPTDPAFAFQEEKMRKLGLNDLVADIIVMSGEKGPYVGELYDGYPTCFVDDSRYQHESVQAAAPGVISLLMQRLGVAYTDSLSDQCLHHVASMSEVDAVLARLQSEAEPL